MVAPYRGPVARAVGSALADRPDKPKSDEGAAALARTYAMLIDNAAHASKYRDAVNAVTAALDALDEYNAVMGADTRKHWDKIVDALAAHTVASDLGPKLLAALTALALTPAGRGAAKGSGVGNSGVGSAPVKSRLELLREQRDGRTQRAG